MFLYSIGLDSAECLTTKESSSNMILPSSSTLASSLLPPPPSPCYPTHLLLTWSLHSRWSRGTWQILWRCILSSLAMRHSWHAAWLCKTTQKTVSLLHSLQLTKSYKEDKQHGGSTGLISWTEASMSRRGGKEFVIVQIHILWVWLVNFFKFASRKVKPQKMGGENKLREHVQVWSWLQRGRGDWGVYMCTQARK